MKVVPTDTQFLCLWINTFIGIGILYQLRILYQKRPDDPIKLAKELNASFLHPYYELITTELIQRAKSEDIGILA